MKDHISNLTDDDLNRLVLRLKHPNGFSGTYSICCLCDTHTVVSADHIREPAHFWPLLWEIMNEAEVQKGYAALHIAWPSFTSSRVMWINTQPGRAICEAWCIVRLASMWLVWR